MTLKRLLSMQRSLIKFNAVLLLGLIIVAVFIFILPDTSFAQTVTQSSQNINQFVDSAGLKTEASLATIIGRIVQIFLAILGVLLILFIIYGGWIWMSSQGDPGKVEKARKIIINAIIGVIVISLAFAIATFVMGFLNGTFGRGGSGGPTIPGGPDDWNRSMIGRGPIESVYPTPNQRGVSIDTQVVVTFKMAMDASTIYNTSTKIITNNIEICEADSVNYNCLNTATSTFKISDYASTTSADSLSDNKTFVFMPGKYLGFNDGVNRIFKVKLKAGIKKINGESVFKDGYYEWVFQTNGKLDLNPPKIVATDVYPAPDDKPLGGPDIYKLVDQPIASQMSTSVSDFSPDLPLRLGDSSTNMKPFVGQALSVDIEPSGEVPSKLDVKVKTDSGFSFNGPSVPTPVSFTITSDGKGATFSDDVKGYFGLDTTSVSTTGNRINFGNGLYVETNGAPFYQGSSYTFYVAKNSDGGLFIISNPNNEYRYLFVIASDTRSIITKASKQYFAVKKGADDNASVKNLSDKINETAGEIVQATSTDTNLIIKAKLAGAAGDSIKIGKSDSAMVNLTGGVSQDWGRSNNSGITGMFDPYNNSLFQITFDKPINPMSLEANNVIVKYDSNADDVVDAVVFASSSLSNQYKTITLKGPYECGKNSCGETVTCWSNSTPLLPTSTKFEISVEAARLRTCDGGPNTWCGSVGDGSTAVGFGGTCSDGARCSKSVSGQTVFYPKTDKPSSGISDLSGNSLNGNFNSYSYSENGSSYVLGVSEGRSTSTGSTAYGYSGKNPFILTTSTPIADSSFGDSIKWSFYLSSEIDLSSPLVKTIFPTGNQDFGIVDGEQSNEPVKVTFDRLMDSSSLKPGWGYSASTTAKEWFERYLVLGTITTGANPVGYWVGKTDDDSNNDGWSDVTSALVYHNNYDNSVQYGPLGGSGLRSITQNCFLPGSGPKYAADKVRNSSNSCEYVSKSSTTTSGCVSDPDLDNERVVPSNPASYAHMKCSQIEGAVNNCNKECHPFYNNTDVRISGSWVITLDHPTSTPPDGRTGCCFGKCEN